MTCDCCHEAEATHAYEMILYAGVVIRFCAKHLGFFAKCAGAVRELAS